MPPEYFPVCRKIAKTRATYSFKMRPAKVIGDTTAKGSRQDRDDFLSSKNPVTAVSRSFLNHLA
jgi:hypothetical protein